MEYENGTPPGADDTPDVQEPSQASGSETPAYLTGAPFSAMVAEVNETVLGLSPAVALAGEYLGAGLATEAGLLSAAGQYQQQSMVSMAAATADVCRLLSGGKTGSGAAGGKGAPEAAAPDPGLEAAPKDPSELTGAKAVEAAQHAAEVAVEKAEAAVEKAEAAVQDTGF